MQKPSFFKKRFKKFKQFIHKEPLLFSFLLLTFIIAVIFRSYKFFDRIYVYADNAIFVQIAYYGFIKHLIPQIGPFAQAPFFTGPWWLWILQIFFLLPFGSLTPWFIMYFFSFISIVLFFYLGLKIGDQWLGAIMAFLAAISTAQIDNFFMTWNASADPFLGLLAVIFFVSFIKNHRASQIFLLGFTISLAFTIHFQTSLLSPLILVALLTTRPKLKNFLWLIFGIGIPLLPFLYFDLRFYWFETRRILDFFLIAQYRIYVPNRWLTYAGVYWPATWANIIGGNFFVAYAIMALSGLVTIFTIKNFKKYRFYFLTVISFLISVILFRYFRGERFFYYTNFAHVFVILISAWTIRQIFIFRKWLGIITLLVITVFTVIESVGNFKARVITYPQVQAMTSQIYQKYPKENFDIYECPYNGTLISTPIAYFIYFDHRSSPNGVKIGVCNENFKFTWREVKDSEVNKPYEYLRKSTPNIYTETTEWWKTNPPKKDSLY